MTTAPARAPRTAGDVARGAGALAAVLVLLVGIPAALSTVAGSPLPRTVPSLDGVMAALTTPDDGRLFLLALSGVAWLGWATFAAAVVVEAVSQLRGRPPLRLPVMGPQQQLARKLVTAIAVVLSAPVLVALPPAHATSATPSAPPAAAPGRPDQLAPGTAADGRPVPAPAPEVLVAPGDTLSGIAEDHLGDADRYPEIAQASRDLVQADGRRLVDADLIYPGWHLRLPAAAGPATPPAHVEDERAPHPGPTTTPPTPEQPAGSRPPAAEPAREAPATAPTSAADAGHAGLDTANDPTADEVEVGTTVGLGALAAAGLIALVTRKRSRQQRHRRTGQRLPVPDDAVKVVEHQLRADQDPWTAADLDRVLRVLVAHSRRGGTPLPAVRLARITDHRIELHLTSPAPLVPPFTTAALGDTLWSLDRQDDRAPADEALDETPPYPALTTIGRDLDGGTVLVDLERAGALTITAAPADGWGEDDHDDTAAQAVLAGMAVELATSAWAEGIQAHLVGVLPDLADALDVERLDHTDDVERLLVELAAWAGKLRLALLAAGLDSAAAARSTGLVPDAWATRVLLVGGHLTDVQTEALQHLLTAEPRVPLAVVTTAPGTLDGSTLSTHHDANLATLHPEALTVVPQALPPEVYRLVAQMLVTASAATAEPPPVDVSTGATDPGVPDPGSPPPADPVDQDDDVPPAATVVTPGDGASTGESGVGLRGPVVRVLGPVEITGARGLLGAESHRARITEVVAFLALHPHRDHYLLDEALWPGDRVPDGRRNQLLSRARRWLGTDDHGQSYVPIVNPDGYRLNVDISTDWSRFRDLVGTSPGTASTEDLHAALGLVRGQPFAGANPRRYAWADIDRQEMIAAVVDTAHESAQRAQHDGDAAAARRAAATGLLAEPGSELLWRDALRAEWLAGDRASLEAMADRFTVLAEEIGGDLEEETLHLLDELLRPRTTRSRPVTVGGGPDAP